MQTSMGMVISTCTDAIINNKLLACHLNILLLKVNWSMYV